MSNDLQQVSNPDGEIKLDVDKYIRVTTRSSSPDYAAKLTHASIPTRVFHKTLRHRFLGVLPRF